MPIARGVAGTLTSLLMAALLLAAQAVPADAQTTTQAGQAGAASAQHYGGGAVAPFSLFAQWAMGGTNNPFSAMNPFQYGELAAAMTSPFVDAMTRHQALQSMMAAFNLQAMFGKPEIDEATGVVKTVPAIRIPGFPSQAKVNVRPNTVTGAVTSQAKKSFYQSMMMMNPLSMRDMVGVMAHKMPVSEELSFDEAVEAMKLRANEVNFKLVGHNPLWLDVRAISGEEKVPRVEIFQFCDAMVARQILDYVPEFVVFLPCRVALIEDADEKLWVMTLDWDVGWLDYVQNPNSVLDADLRTQAKRIRDALYYIMEGAATGEF